MAVLPPHQGLEPNHVTAPQIHDGLVVEHELILFERLLQLVLELQVPQRPISVASDVLVHPARRLAWQAGHTVVPRQAHLVGGSKSLQDDVHEDVDDRVRLVDSLAEVVLADHHQLGGLGGGGGGGAQLIID